MARLVVRGAGDVGSAVAWHLRAAGHAVVAKPLFGSQGRGIKRLASPDALPEADPLPRLRTRPALVPHPAGTVTVRSTPSALTPTRAIAAPDDVLVALDAAPSPAPGESGSGEQALAAALDRYRQ